MTTEETEVLQALEKATHAAFALLRRKAGHDRDDDDWTRLPRPANTRKGDPGTRCPVSGWSRTTISSNDRIRKKSVGGSRFYALADVRRILTNQPAITTP